MTFEQILKAASSSDRDAVVAAVEAQAEVIAKREGCGMDRARAKVWNETGAHQAYEDAAVGKPKRREPKMFRATEAEAILDERARKIMKKDPNIGYARACSKALEADPSLYTRYEAEIAAGGRNSKFLVPEPQDLFDTPARKSDVSRLRAAADEDEDDDDGATCDKCGHKLT